MSEKPTEVRSSCARISRSSSAPQLAALFTKRAKSLAPCGPRPPQVPNAIGQKAQQARKQCSAYLAFLAASFRVKKLLQRSLDTGPFCSACCHPWLIVRSTAQSKPPSQDRNSKSAGRNCPSGQLGTPTSRRNGWEVCCRSEANASCTAKCLFPKFILGQQRRWSPVESKAALQPTQ